MNIFVLGPAGSGKSLLVKNFSTFLSREGYTIRTVNLDPGVLDTGYKADFDIRSAFTIEKIMRETGLGPNGAILEAMNRLANMRVPEFNEADHVIFDTPGQLEPFLFRDVGRRIIGGFRERCCFFLGDLTALKDNLLGFYLYALTAYYTLETETIAILNKVDLLSEEETELVKRIIRGPMNLLNKPESLKDDMSIRLLRVIKRFFPPKRVPLISAKTWEGFEDLLTILYEIKCVCGDLT